MGSLPDPDDPRITGKTSHTIADWPGSLTLVGVVHDHPASVFRVRPVIQARAPDVVALEIPPLSTSTFEQHARTDRVPPRRGGEMSDAIQAARTDAILGIDGPSARYFRKFARRLFGTRGGVPVRPLVGAAGRVTRATIESRLPTGTAPTAVREPVDYEVDHGDPPAAQARHERRQIRRANSLLDDVGRSGSKTALELQNSTREGHMVDELLRQCADTSAVAVVGVHHLDGLRAQLEARTPG